MEIPFAFILSLTINLVLSSTKLEGQCSSNSKELCDTQYSKPELYKKATNDIFKNIQKALQTYAPCKINDKQCKCFEDVIENELTNYRKNGVTKEMIDSAGKFGTRYKIINHRLYRDADCMFPSRCSGIEHFLIKLLPNLDDTELVINTRDWPQLPIYHSAKGPVFSFSKTNDYRDIMYPAWTFWAGGPAISLHPTGIGRWDLLRESISKAAEKYVWSDKKAIGFFRGSRTSDERDTLILLSRRKPDLVDAKYTKNQAWKTPQDTLNEEPAAEVSFADHCRYKYLFNFRGVAASFRFKHLFLCKSLVFHVGDEWNEFFYFALKPWIHYVPLKSYPKEHEIEQILTFFQEHDSLAKQIAERGYEFIWNNLSLQDVECYWETLLKRYKRLLKFTVKLDENLIEIKEKERN